MVILGSNRNFIGIHSLDIPVGKSAVAVIEVVEMPQFAGMSSQFAAVAVAGMTGRFVECSSPMAGSVTGVVVPVARTRLTAERSLADYRDPSTELC